MYRRHKAIPSLLSSAEGRQNLYSTADIAKCHVHQRHTRTMSDPICIWGTLVLLCDGSMVLAPAPRLFLDSLSLRTLAGNAHPINRVLCIRNLTIEPKRQTIDAPE